MRRNKIYTALLVGLLVITSLFLAFKNFTPNTWLTGWDNIHSEFNFPLNVIRAVNASWQEYQGVGLNGGMAHAADLPRILILWLSSLILPTQVIRYFWVFSMLLIGPIGVYFLINRALLVKENRLVAFVGGAFYTLNLATVQYFYTSFEPFVSFFGFLPWLLYFGLRYLREGNKRILLSFALVSLIATPAFLVQTLFVVYSVILAVFALETIVKKRLLGLARGVKLVAVTVAINAFWLLPVVYFTFVNSSVLKTSTINIIATRETRLFNENRGTLVDTATLRGFWLDYYDLYENGKFDYVMKSWVEHLSQPSVESLGIILFSLAVIGAFVAIFRKDFKFRFVTIILLVISTLMLGGSTGLLGSWFGFLEKNISLFTQMFRSVFTKWSVAAALIYSVGISFLVLFLGKLFRGRLVVLSVLLSTFIVYSSFVIVRPAFSGALIYKNIKVDIPKEYFEVFGFFENQPKESRVAHFPTHTFWGWNFYDWGYAGSGFLWYGIEQPILDRAFDVWSRYNESFYREMSHAVYSQSLTQLENVLDKYRVGYFLMDESVIQADGRNSALYFEETKNLLAESEHVRLVEKFGFLSIYETDFDLTEKFVWAPDSYTKVNTDQVYSQIDPIYAKLGNYIEDVTGPTYPFVNFDRRMGVTVEVSNNQVVIRSRPLEFPNKKNLAIPDLLTRSDLVNAEVSINEGTKRVEVTYEVNEKISEDFSLKRGFKEAKNCDLKENGSVSKESRGNSVFYGAYDGGTSCDFYHYPDLAYSQGYILRVKGENKTGRGLKIYLFNEKTRRMDLEELLPEGKFDEYFFILPRPVEGEGYTLNVETRSFGRIASENVIEAIEIVPFPYEWLTNIKLDTEDSLPIQNSVVIKEVQKFGTAHYVVKVEGDGLVVLGQGYEEGWRAYSIRHQTSDIRYQLAKAFPWWFGEELKHVQVNTWQNGWLLNDQWLMDNDLTINHQSSTIIIVYWPQYLEYAGLAILGTTLFSLFFYSRKSRRV